MSEQATVAAEYEDFTPCTDVLVCLTCCHAVNCWVRCWNVADCGLNKCRAFLCSHHPFPCVSSESQYAGLLRTAVSVKHSSAQTSYYSNNKEVTLHPPSAPAPL